MKVYVDKSTGEIMDREKFVKLYDASILRKLSLSGVKIFSYVCEHITYKGEVELCVDDVSRECGYKNLKSVYHGISELLTLGVLVKKRRGLYEVNLKYLYRGRRI